MLASLRPHGPRLRLPSPVKLRAVNIVPQCYLPGVSSTSGWAKMWLDFNWVGWFKPQIDLAAANGANAVKITIHGPGITEVAANISGGAGGETWPDAATLYGRFRGFLDYCRSQRLSVFINLMGGGNQTFGTANDAARLAATVQTAGWCETIPDSPVVAIDICNEVEINGPPSWSNQAAMLADLGTLRAALRAVTSLPLTASCGTFDPSMWTRDLAQALAPLVDFHDFHPYYGGIPNVADVAGLVSAPWFKGRFIVGEVGVNQGRPQGEQTAFLNGIGGISAHPLCWGATLFCAADYDVADGPVQQWGASDLNVQNPRGTVLAAFRNWPGAA